MAKTSDGKSIIGSGSPKRRLPKLTKKTAIIGVVLLLVLVIAVTAFVLLRPRKTSEKPKVQATTTCTDPSANNILAAAEPLLDSTDQTGLSSVVEKIKALPGHDRDPNCLSVIAKYYVNISDAANAKLYFEKLEAVYNQENGYDATIAAKVYTPDTLKPIVEFLQKDQEKIKDNSFYVPRQKR